MPLPVNIDSSHTDSGDDPSVKTHQQHHDVLHAFFNNFEGSVAFTTALRTKLNGIESGATADQTAAEILTKLLTVDGPGSGLNADLLDGQQASEFAASGHSHEGAQQAAGTQVKLVYMTPGVSDVPSQGWYAPNGTTLDLAGRTVSVTWEGTAAQIPAQGTGDTDFKVGDTALIRPTSL